MLSFQTLLACFYVFVFKTFGCFAEFHVRITNMVIIIIQLSSVMILIIVNLSCVQILCEILSQAT